MTLKECIAKYEAAQPAPVAITPLGCAHVAVRRLARALADLDDPQDRAAVLADLAVTIRPLIADLARA